jgi:quercetin dioxygenase-like cupin family protein
MDRVPANDNQTVEAVADVHLAQGATGESVSVQYFHIEPGATVPEHSHHHEQAGFIYHGEATFLLGNAEELVIGAGDSYVLAGYEVHGVENRGDEPVKGIDVFSPPRPDPDWAE